MQAQPETATAAGPAAAAADGRPSRARRVWAKADTFVYPAATLLALLVLWELAVEVFDIAPYLAPKPTEIVAELDRNWPVIQDNIRPTVEEIVLGFLLSIAVGVPLAVAIVGSTFFEKTLYPILVASQTVPKVALAPLFVVWFGFGQTPKVLIAFLVAFFPIVIDTAVGLRSVPGEMIDLARSSGASRTALFWKIRMPYALPNFFAGLKVAVTLAVIGAVVGEFLGADKGLGYLLVIANGQLDTTLLYTDIIVLAVIGIVSFLIVDVIERLTIPWHQSVRRVQHGTG
jgi:NitT/TauT family transport system permease protein